ncbi:NAD(P)/FAD-dependent oxidoreductase [Telluribacter sp. SYSU D00476]|uniref:NAD(P)/FAD-dependent oxidoreductase n=1 Tax=Telluribacter sp. SYSU D00476 TaxID=2811430 RepID=UPI001FF12770|nr:FAD-dependent oxidoreductase [Telluribacter sp. SYSU D00476]
MPSCIIIGAGLAGLTAARELTRHQWQVTLLDKGRGVGGRMATRRIHNTRADHGAQYFSARTPEFQAQVQAMKEAGVVKEWYLPGIDHHPRYVGSSGMSAIPKYLAEGLDIHTGEKVVHVAGDATGCTVRTEAGTVYTAEKLIVTIPAPQVKALLTDSGIQLSTTEQVALDTINYQPCLAVIAELNQPSRIPAPGGIRYEEGPISWVADNFQKGITYDSTTVTIHASPQYSREHLEGDLNKVGEMLIAELHEWIPAEAVESFQVHRWRYSLCDQRHPEPYLQCNTPFPLLLGGDGFGMGNVEGAYQSGLQMARALVGEA